MTVHLLKALLPCFVCAGWAVLTVIGLPDRPLTVCGLLALAGALFIAESEVGK